MKKILLAASSTMALTLATQHAYAQAMDYGQLEQLFGESVTTSATGSPLRASEAPVNMTIITAEEITRSGSNNIPDILRHYAGIDVTRWSSQSADVSVHGYNGPDAAGMLVLVNGRQVYLDHYGMVQWNAIPVQLNEIRQIEVVKGPAGALFGFNAAVGVINIITYDPIFDDLNVVQARTGSQNDIEGSAVVSHKFSDDLAAKLSFGGIRNDEFGSPAQPGFTDVSRINPDSESIDLDVVAKPIDGMTVDLEGSHSKTDVADPAGYAAFGNQRYQTSSLGLRGTYDSGLGTISWQAYHNWLTVNLLPANNGATGLTFPILNEITVAQVSDLFKLDADNTVRVGFEYRHNTLLGTTPGPLPAGTDLAYDDFAPSAMWSWKILSNLALTAAGRLDSYHLGLSGPVPAGNPARPDAASFSNDLTGLTYNAGLVWQATDIDSFRIDAARGLQIPGLVSQGWDEPLSVGPFSAALTGDAKSKPVDVNNYEVGYDRALPDFASKLRVSAFYEELHGLLTQTSAAIAGGNGTANNPFIIPFGLNIGSSKTAGAEIGLSGNIADNWTYGLSYTYQNVNDKLRNNLSTGFLTVGQDYRDQTPASVINARLGYTLGKFQGDLFADYMSHTKSDLEAASFFPYTLTNVKANTTISARLAYEVSNGVTVAFEGYNLGQKDISYSSSPAIQRRIFASVTAKF